MKHELIETYYFYLFILSRLNSTTQSSITDQPPYEQTVVVYLDDVIYEQPPIESLSMLFYHPALPLPNHNTQYFENLYHIQSLLDLMTLMQMVLDSYV